MGNRSHEIVDVRIGKKRKVVKIGMVLNDISPMTANQRITFEAYGDSKNLMLHGTPGTGKTFIALYLGLYDVLVAKNYSRVTIVRSIVPTRDIGYLPGTMNEKIQAYEMPYIPVCSELFGQGDAYSQLKTKGMINFISTSHIRGITINDSVVVVDECENLNYHELCSIITRLGENSRIIFCGDFGQSDFTNHRERTGILDFMKILERMESFANVEFKREDIVRSGLVKEFIIAKEDLGF